ncbi:MAG: molybdopterin-dependent oxidoreductase, partial [Gammaproteobacteria bacterium]|nr:molybdopterin-dependent oxidoreductase [Gammaproteobacteria bacterium]NIR97593.1 molybdopterin-dependent oxidoreductase [Gammaproteobacteria bacterium]NIT64683.1 molybdopterin-dependent oxidoreductase [Gammaproteobacteria bacterium]NIY33263.1 molybdopterin-dependent oxidoreductase [Gammaproteobacteria bacterium]
VLLPVAPFAETGGTFVNVEGRRQGFHAAVKPAGEARPAWKVLRVLGNLLECEGFEYAAEHQIGAELEQSCGAIRPDNRLSWKCPGMLPEDRGELVRLAEFPAYSVDGVVRRARALQETVLVPAAGAYMNESTLKALGLAPGERVVVSQGEQTVSLTAEHDPRLPERCVVVSGGTAECGALGAPFAAIEIGKD